MSTMDTSKLVMSVTPEDYLYRIVTVKKFVDGDTYDLMLSKLVRVDIGLHIKQELYTYPEIRVRLTGPDKGVDTPEKLRGSVFERQKAAEAKALATGWLTQSFASGPVYVRTARDVDDDGLSRWLGDIFDSSGAHLSDFLIALKLATVWPTHWYEVYDIEGRKAWEDRNK
jgi:endonuclease YncB( thermonuclease family)